MPKYIIEREIPGAGNMSSKELAEIAGKSKEVLHGLGPEIQWVTSFVTDNKIYCVYIAPHEEIIRKHGEQGGFPVDAIAQVKREIDPTTAEQ
jgi:hypothetical protein